MTPRLVSLDGGRAPTIKPANSREEQRFLYAVDRMTPTLNEIRNELKTGLKNDDYELTLRAAMRLLAISLVFRDEANKVPR